jgi:DNA-binding NarL/FixJ family response regulator
MVSPLAALTLVRIIVADQHEIIRRTLGIYLGQLDGVELVGEAGSAQEALALCERCHPDAVLLDMALPGMDGIEMIRAIRRNHPHSHVIGMTDMELKRMRPEALDAGAAQLIYKGSLCDDLLDAIAAAMHPV